MATASEHFSRQDSGLSQIFKLMVTTSKKRLNNINVVVREEKLKTKTAHFRLLSVAQKRCMIKTLLKVT